jgi:lysophospholipase L1-like esterase
MKRYVFYTLLAVCITLIAAETYLRVTGKYATYFESIGQNYTTYYNQVSPTWYLVHWKRQNYIPPNSDFQYPYSINKYGIRERDFEKNKKDSGIRIFVTGDSFAEGQGAPYDSTWPHLLSRYLVDEGISAEVLNTGVAGSDPVYNYVLHRDILKDCKADYIIVSINSSDFSDYLMRGGFERFYKDGTTHFRNGPWYQSIYRRSFFARGVIEKIGRFPFRGVFSNEEDFCTSADEAIACYSAVVDSFVNLVKPDSTRIIVVLFPTPADIRFKTNVTKKFQDSFVALQQQLNKKNIACINIWDDLDKQLADKNYLQYTYQNDWHFKPCGYDLMARLVEKKLIEKGMISGGKNAQ